MKPIILLLFISSVFIHNLHSCDPPSNQPTGLELNEVNNSIKISFQPAENGTTPANTYLIIMHTKPNFLETPANGTAYIKDGKGFENGKIIYAGPDREVDWAEANSDTEYYFTVFSYNTNGNCYNITNPLTNKIITAKDSGTTNVTNKLSTLLNFNFAGEQNGWTNLTPIVFYGWTKSGKNKWLENDSSKYWFLGWKNAFQMGPYIGSTIALKDSTSFLPSLMLPGNGGIQINYFMTFFNEEKFSVIISPLNFGLKVISGYTDSTLSVVQHNLRTACSIQFAEFFNASVQYSRGWHNLTSKSSENFSTIFKNKNSKITYLNVNLTTRLSPDLFPDNTGKNPLFLSISWHSLARSTNYAELPNSKFITIGLITNMDVKSGNHPGYAPQAPNF